MINKHLRVFLSAISLYSILLAATSVHAAPVRFAQVRQVVNVKPSQAKTGNFTQLQLINNNLIAGTTSDGDNDNDNDDDKKKAKTPQPQQERVIIETRTDIIEDEACDCPQPTVGGGGFPKWALLGLGIIPFLFLIPHDDDDTPTPTPTLTPTTTPTSTPTTTPTTTPTMTPTTTPTATPTETPTTTPTVTPTPEPVPEPVTILLFGTGLAGIGVAARKRFRRKDDEAEAEDNE